MAEFLNLNLILELTSLDCGSTNESKSKLGNYFNLEGDFLDERPEQTITCLGCDLKVFVDLKKI